MDVRVKEHVARGNLFALSSPFRGTEGTAFSLDLHQCFFLTMLNGEGVRVGVALWNKRRLTTWQQIRR